MDPSNARKKLASNDPEERARGAEFLQKAYAKDPLALGDHGEQYWAERMKRLERGDPNDERTILADAVMRAGGEGGGGGHSEGYQLDPFWITTVWRSDRGDAKIYHADPPRRWVQHVDVAPPASFTGTWTTYYVNGAIRETSDVERGKVKHSREFHDNGQLRAERTWNDGGADGKVVQHLRDGGPEWEDSYASGKQVGVALWYWDNGKVRQESHYQDGKLEGTMKNFDESGRMTSCSTYHAGDQVDGGCEAVTK